MIRFSLGILFGWAWSALSGETVAEATLRAVLSGALFEVVYSAGRAFWR